MNLVLNEIGAAERPTLMVFNKIDRFQTQDRAQQFLDRYPKSVAVSARSGEGIPQLLGELGAALRPIRQFVELRLPHEASAIIAKLHQVGEVVECDYSGAEVSMKARIQPHHRAEFARFVVQDLTVS